MKFVVVLQDRDRRSVLYSVYDSRERARFIVQELNNKLFYEQTLHDNIESFMDCRHDEGWCQFTFKSYEMLECEEEKEL